MGGHTADAIGSEDFVERVAAVALGAVPVVAGLGVVAMVISPEAFAETDAVAGSTPWAGAVAGLAALLAVTALPLGLFSWALRAGRRPGLLAVAVVAPLLILFVGVLPLAGAIAGGWQDLSALAVLVSAGCAVLEAFVLAAALRLFRRGSTGS